MPLSIRPWGFCDRCKPNTRWGRYARGCCGLPFSFGFAVYLMFITPDMAYMAAGMAYGTYILMTPGSYRDSPFPIFR